MSEENQDVVSQEQLAADKALKEDLASLLSNGLEVEVEPRAYTHEDILEIVGRLQKLDENDYQSKLSISGFTLTPYLFEGDPDDEQACETCMYYKVHRQFCELPELMVPVEPEWSCRLWRI